MSKTYSILFLCTGNSARSVLAEALMNKLGEGRFKAYSAGSMPAGKINPGAVPVVEALGFDAADFRSKSWDEFAAPGAPPIDFISTVCDNAAGEVCPIWPGKPMTAHWGLPDPANVEGGKARAEAFQATAKSLTARINLLLALPLDDLDDAALKARIREIGQIDDGAQ